MPKIAKMSAAVAAALLAAACVTTPVGSPGASVTSVERLAAREWLIEDIENRGVVDNSRATLLFGSDGRLSGSSTCNRLIASYHTDGAKLSIDTVGLTMMACPPALMDQERRLVALLPAITRFRIDGTGALILHTNTGATITAR